MVSPSLRACFEYRSLPPCTVESSALPHAKKYTGWRSAERLDLLLLDGMTACHALIELERPDLDITREWRRRRAIDVLLIGDG